MIPESVKSREQRSHAKIIFSESLGIRVTVNFLRFCLNGNIPRVNGLVFGRVALSVPRYRWRIVMGKALCVFLSLDRIKGTI